ncbi:MAG TPA: peptide chain release factor N(5)-glutamine methyltransferase [Thermoanaerobaculia bacterium]|nr:peptide chain release factor N(5)-glutamine methyltransferase [Thermoanaerobaculia bacterium]
MRSERLDTVRTRLRDEALQRGISPRDVDLLLGDLLRKPLSYLLAHGEEIVDASPVEELLQRRYAGEPLQYIRGRCEFYSREFLVDARVLVPRPETELVVEAAIDHAPRGGRVLDIGTGTGCIAISIAKERADLRVLTTDISMDALQVAAQNRRRLEANVQLVCSDLASGVRGPFDLVVSNPPYVAEEELAGLTSEVRSYEPRIALTPGPRGTEAIEKILTEVASRLTPAGRLILEMGYGQQREVARLAADSGYAVEKELLDLAGIPRVIVLSRSVTSDE